MWANPGSINLHISFVCCIHISKKEVDSMDQKHLHSLIDAYTLHECVMLLYYFAPDLYESIAEDVFLAPDDPRTLAKARAALHRALLEECKPN